MSRRFQLAIVILTLVLAPLSVLFAHAYWFSEGHGAPLGTWSRVRLGMSRGQVIALLGRPSSIEHSADGSECWYYTRRTFCMVEALFTPAGFVRETAHDH